MQSESELRADMIRIARHMYAKGLVAGTDGNLSVRVGTDRLLTTPSGRSKAWLAEDELVLTDLAGAPVDGKKPSSEIRMHLKVYEIRPEVQACVHAHPPVTTAFSLAGLPLSERLPESVLYLGAIAFTDYATPTTADVPASIAAAIPDHDVLVLSGHGSLTVGASLEEAYVRLEALEHCARVASEAIRLRGCEGLPPLTEEELIRLWSIHERATGRKRPGTCPRACGGEESSR